MFPVFLLTWYLFLVLSPKTYSGLKKFPFPYNYILLLHFFSKISLPNLLLPCLLLSEYS
jgi:hypothetical protein